MTERLNTQVVLPTWLIVSLFAMVIPFTIYVTTQIRTQQNTATKVEILQAEMQKKADKETVTTMQQDIREIRESTEDIKNLLLAK